MTHYTPFETAYQAEAAFNEFVNKHGGVNSELAMNALGNAFSIDVAAEYPNDLIRWTVALATAREYVDQGVTGY